MTVPADGVARLTHFIDARLQQLRMTKDEAVRRGFPDPDTLAKIRSRATQKTPRVRTLLRIDRTLGWQPGSAAVALLGGTPLTLTARSTKGVLARERAAQPMTADEVVQRLLAQLHDEIALTRTDLLGAAERLQRLQIVHNRLVEEFHVDEHLLREFDTDDEAA